MMKETSAVPHFTFQRSHLLHKLGLSDLSLSQLPMRVANRYRREQLRSTIDQMRVMMIGTTLFAPALSFQAWNSGVNGLVIAWTLFMIAFSWGTVFSWRKLYNTDGRPRHLHRFVVEAGINAFSWCVGVALFYPIVSGDHKAIVATVMAGSLARGAMGFSQTPIAGFVYLWVQTLGFCAVTLVCAVMHGSSTDLLMTCLSLAGGCALFKVSIDRGRVAMMAFKHHDQLSEKSEVIELLLKDYEEQSVEWLWQCDARGLLTSAPHQVLELFGVAPSDMRHANFLDLIEAKGTMESRNDFLRLKESYKSRSEFHDIRIAVFDKTSGGLRWILMKGRPQFDNGKFRGFRGIFADITLAITAERRITFLAEYDGLTELLNRNTVQKRLSELDLEKHCATAFLIDLDGFKQINDSYGHDIGDCLLQKVAQRLKGISAIDAWAARLGGDEFFILATGEKAQSKASNLWRAQDICDQLSQPFRIGNFVIQVSASVGIASFPEDCTSGLDLLTLSDLALYEAKNTGRNRVAFFNVEMREKLLNRVKVIERLRVAVRNESIVPFYQSQHALDGGRLIGFEALARWFDEELGFVGPDVFIPIAEQSGLIVTLGEQIMRKACSDAANWWAILGEDAPVVSVNISPVQFARTDVTSLVSQVLHDTGLPAKFLEVEITEGVLISDKDRIAATLRQLSELGVSIALDDFGTGYSSLSYLKELPLNRLKIDRTFVNDLHADAPMNPIVSTVIQLGHNLGLSVIAEGVENEVHVELLSKLGCDDGQGYHYGRPINLEDANALIAEVERSNYVAGTGPIAASGTNR